MEQRDQAQTELHARPLNFRLMPQQEPKRLEKCCALKEGTPEIDEHFRLALSIKCYSTEIYKILLNLPYS